MQWITLNRHVFKVEWWFTHQVILIYHVDKGIYSNRLIDTSSFYNRSVACIRRLQVKSRRGGVRVSYYWSLGVIPYWKGTQRIGRYICLEAIIQLTLSTNDHSSNGPSGWYKECRHNLLHTDMYTDIPSRKEVDTANLLNSWSSFVNPTHYLLSLLVFQFSLNQVTGCCLTTYILIDTLTMLHQLTFITLIYVLLQSMVVEAGRASAECIQSCSDWSIVLGHCRGQFEPSRKSETQVSVRL